MSTTFDTKQQAINFGLCIWDKDSIIQKIDMNVNIDMVNMDIITDMDIYELITKDGKKRIGVEPFRSGYCLWIIRPNGFMVRL